MRSRHSSVDIVTRRKTGILVNRGLITQRAKKLLSSPDTQNGSGDHTDSDPMGTEQDFPEGKAAEA